MKQILLLDTPITIGSYKNFISSMLSDAKNKKHGYACIANVHSIVESHNSERFAKNFWNADYITPDGKPLTWALKLIYGIQQDRVAGMDLLPDVIKEAEKRQLSVYFYGGDEAILEGTKNYIEKKHPHLEVKGFYSPPFRLLNAEEETEVVAKINKANPDLLFVVLGCPKQENWMHDMSPYINSFMLGVGGALPVMIGTLKRAPVWMQKAGLEWLFRLMQEPKRLFKRYAVTNTLFIMLLLKKIVSYRWQGRISTIIESN